MPFQKGNKLSLGIKRSEEFKNKLSNLRIGGKNPMYEKASWNKGVKGEEYFKHYPKGIWNKGLTKFNNGKIKKVAESKIGNKYSLGFKHSIESREKMKLARAKQTIVIKPETRLRISKSNKGKLRTKQQRINLSQSKLGNKNPAWKGGKSFEPYSSDFNIVKKRRIAKRDNHICQICNIPGKCIHHIDYNKMNNRDDNLVLLCKSCHSKTNNNRDCWIAWFEQWLAWRLFEYSKV